MFLEVDACDVASFLKFFAVTSELMESPVRGALCVCYFIYAAVAWLESIPNCLPCSDVQPFGGTFLASGGVRLFFLWACFLPFSSSG